MLTQHVILSLKQTLDSTHQRATLTCKVAGSLTLEGCLEQVASTDTDTKGDGLLLSLARVVLINSVRAVQTATLKEHCAERGARTLRSNHDNVDVGGRNNTCAVVPVDSKTVRVVKGLARCEIFLDCWPSLNLTCV